MTFHLGRLLSYAIRPEPGMRCHESFGGGQSPRRRYCRVVPLSPLPCSMPSPALVGPSSSPPSVGWVMGSAIGYLESPYSSFTRVASSCHSPTLRREPYFEPPCVSMCCPSHCIHRPSLPRHLWLPGTPTRSSGLLHGCLYRLMWAAFSCHEQPWVNMSSRLMYQAAIRPRTTYSRAVLHPCV